MGKRTRAALSDAMIAERQAALEVSDAPKLKRCPHPNTWKRVWDEDSGLHKAAPGKRAKLLNKSRYTEPATLVYDEQDGRWNPRGGMMAESAIVERNIKADYGTFVQLGPRSKTGALQSKEVEVWSPRRKRFVGKGPAVRWNYADRHRQY